MKGFYVSIVAISTMIQEGVYMDMDLGIAAAFFILGILFVTTTLFLLKQDLFFHLIFITIFPFLNLLARDFMLNIQASSVYYIVGLNICVVIFLLYFLRNSIQKFNEYFGAKLNSFFNK